MIVLLDTGVLGLVLHPISEKNRACNKWMERKSIDNYQFAIPEIADYELRRELIRSGKTGSVSRLDEFNKVYRYLPITTGIMRNAALFWAETRNKHKPAARDESLDADMILVAQAKQLECEGEKIIVATDNIKHFADFVIAKKWCDI